MLSLCSYHSWLIILVIFSNSSVNLCTKNLSSYAIMRTRNEHIIEDTDDVLSKIIAVVFILALRNSILPYWIFWHNFLINIQYFGSFHSLSCLSSLHHYIYASPYSNLIHLTKTWALSIFPSINKLPKLISLSIKIVSFASEQFFSIVLILSLFHLISAVETSDDTSN